MPTDLVLRDAIERVRARRWPADDGDALLIANALSTRLGESKGEGRRPWPHEAMLGIKPQRVSVGAPYCDHGIPIGQQEWCEKCNPPADTPGEPTAEEYPFGCFVTDMDTEAFLNLRDWLQMAIERAGAKVDGAGIGLGQADLTFSLDGAPYYVSVQPRPLAAARGEGR